MWIGAAFLRASRLVGGLSAVALLATLRAHGDWGVAYPPKDTGGQRPAIVFFHGMWAGPEESCGLLEQAATPYGFLVCPRANTPFGDGGRMWSGNYASVAPQVRAALDAANALAPGKLDRSRGGTLIGYSNGAYFAVEVALAEPMRWSSLVLLSMSLDLDAGRLRAAGVRRMVFAAAEKDGVRASVQELAQHIDAAGLPSRFVSLGPGSHELPPDTSDRLCEALAWAREEQATACRQ